MNSERAGFAGPFLLRSAWRDVEVQNVFADAEALIERDRRVVALIGLDEDHMRAPLDGDPRRRLISAVATPMRRKGAATARS